MELLSNPLPDVAQRPNAKAPVPPVSAIVETKQTPVAVQPLEETHETTADVNEQKTVTITAVQDGVLVTITQGPEGQKLGQTPNTTYPPSAFNATTAAKNTAAAPLLSTEA